MVRTLILDTDIDTDCDDAGALAVLHALADRGEVAMLGVVCSVPVRACATCVAAINAWYGRPEIPVGLIRIPGWETDPNYAPYRKGRDHVRNHIYNEAVGRPWAEAHPEWEPAEAVGLYRRILAARPDGSVTICAIGTLSALAQLLESGPDEHSPLPGRELVACKVRELVTMALGSYPQGQDSFNWRMDLRAAGAVVNHWPTRLVVSEWGEAVQTGAHLTAVASEEQPVARAYRIYLGGQGRTRSSWDQLAVHYTVRDGAGVFVANAGYTLVLDATAGVHHWRRSWPGDRERLWLTPLVGNDALARVIEDLMVASLAGRETPGKGNP